MGKALKKTSSFSLTKRLKILNRNLFYNWLGIIRILLIPSIDQGIKFEDLNGDTSFSPFVIFTNTTNSW